MKSVRNRILAVTAAVVMSCVGAANAFPVTDSLYNLVASGGSIGIGDKEFSGFGYVTSGLTSFDAHNIIVTASVDANGVYYLTWGGDISLISVGAATADLKLNYSVTAQSPNVIYAIDQNYTGDALNGLLSVVETATISGGQVVGSSHLTVTDFSDPAAESNDIIDIVPPQSTLYVTKDIAFGVFGNGFVSVSQVQQSFHQRVPDGGTTAILLGAAVSLVGLLRKKLMA